MVAAFDNTPQQFGADGLLLLLIIINAVVGWRTGSVRRVVSFAGLYVGAVVAFYSGNVIAAAVDKGSIYASAWLFLAITAVVVIGFEGLGRLFSDRLERLVVLAFDRVAGLFIGAAVGFFQALLVFLVAISVGAAPSLPGNSVPADHDAAAKAIRAATLSSQAVRAEPALLRILTSALSTDLTTHFLDGSTLTSTTP